MSAAANDSAPPRAKLKFDEDFEEAPKVDQAKAQEISERAGFPSRPVVAPTAGAPRQDLGGEHEGRGGQAPAPAPAPVYRRPGRPILGRSVAINTRVYPEAADKIYALRDEKAGRTIADVIEEAVSFYMEHRTDQQ